MSELTCREVNDDVLSGITPPAPGYYLVLFLLAGGIGWMMLCWIYQIRWGMGVAGISHPVNWGVYIANFVFWVGIAHSGTLISAILHLVRSRWRTAVSRSAEAMTIFAILTAGLFPLVHLGRVWVFYYILPYPSDRQLWPNFISPLVWDVVAITTYLMVSLIFFYVGLLPDLASTRDHWTQTRGPRDLRARFYRYLSLGWAGTSGQWLSHSRAYLFFAALATPLVVSVHSVVSWDFAMSLLPGWHTTIFAPYFVAGAIHSGLAMVLILLIPLRRLLRLERIITIEQFDAAAQTLLVTTLIIAYAYVVEPFIAWYSGDVFERQFTVWRATGYLAIPFWLLIPLNVLFPALFFFRYFRRRIFWLFTISVLINVGMWLERVVIVPSALSHDFLPHNWGQYFPTWVEGSITVGSFAFFLFLFLAFTKILPTVAISDVKEELVEKEFPPADLPAPAPGTAARVGKEPTGVLAVFRRAPDLIHALGRARTQTGCGLEVYSPVRLERAERLLNRTTSPVRIWTLAGAVAGLAGGFALAIGTALVNRLIVGAKPPVSIIPYCIIGFEATILLGTIFNFIGMIVHAPLRGRRLPPGYDRRFSRDRFGLFLACGPERFDAVRTLLSDSDAEEVHVIR